MKFALTILATVTLLGCYQEDGHLPGVVGPRTASASPASSLAALWVMVIDEGGMCIVGATVQVVRGQDAGQSVVQTTPCDAWADSGGVVFRDLTPGVEMTVRGSASGYVPQEMTVVPSVRPVFLVPSPAQ